MEKHSVIPLNESNYATWKLQMKMTLIRDDLYGIVDGSENEPEQFSFLERENTESSREMTSSSKCILY